MPKRRKTYNKMKHLAMTADHLLKNKVLCYTNTLKGCYMIDLKQSRIVPPESKEGTRVMAALMRPHTWSCYIAVFGRHDHEEYMKGEQLFTSSRYYQEDLAPVFEEHHGRLIRDFNPNHMCGVGWIADPSGQEISEKVAGHIFEQLDAWN